MISPRFSREAFEQSDTPAALGDELARLVLDRLKRARDPELEARAIIEDLRHAGHELWSWDESIDFTVWGDNYVDPPSRNRFLIEMQWPDPDETEEATDFEVEVTFGPWPRKEPG